jgi:hypothetical protein
MSETFHVSSFCQDGGCVAAAVGDETTAVRDEKDPTGVAFTVPRAAWLGFTAALRRGDLVGPT